MKRLFCLLMVAMLFGCAQMAPVDQIKDEGLVNGFPPAAPEPETVRMYESVEACEAAGVSCVALNDPETGGLTGKYVPLGSVKEGEHITLSFDQKPEDVCEAGLIAVRDLKMFENDCGVPACPCYVCTKCSDGECGLGENECNCPQDCLEDKSPVWFDLGDGGWKVHDPSCGSGADMNCIRQCFEKGEVKLNTGLRMNVWEDCVWSEDVYEILETDSGKEVLCFRPRCVPNTGVDADNKLITDCTLSCQ